MEYLIFFIFVFLLVLASGYAFKRRVIINEVEILICNSPLGVEKIYVAGAQVANQFSFSGKLHRFEVSGSLCEVDYFMMKAGLTVGISVRKDGQLIYSDK